MNDILEEENSSLATPGQVKFFIRSIIIIIVLLAGAVIWLLVGDLHSKSPGKPRKYSESVKGSSRNGQKKGFDGRYKVLNQFPLRGGEWKMVARGDKQFNLKATSQCEVQRIDVNGNKIGKMQVLNPGVVLTDILGRVTVTVPRGSSPCTVYVLEPN